MINYTIQNQYISIGVSSFGGELKSLKNLETGQEYMWEADPKYWGKTSPVLFPIVGSLNQGNYTYQDKTYTLSQHGFARDMEFTLDEQTQDKLVFKLLATEETQVKYPFIFELKITYQIQHRQVKIIWTVTNLDQKTMYFSIGGHPAFVCPLTKEEKQTDYFLEFNTQNALQSTMINESGLAIHEKEKINLDNGILPISENLFDLGALIIEKNQASKVSLLKKDRTPYITVTMDAPLFGIWSPAKKQAPFVCIEPWYGRCDKVDYAGTLEEREWGNQLAPAEVFQKSYEITVY